MLSAAILSIAMLSANTLNPVIPIVIMLIVIVIFVIMLSVSFYYICHFGKIVILLRLSFW
jgi:hypothetical protein